MGIEQFPWAHRLELEDDDVAHLTDRQQQTCAALRLTDGGSTIADRLEQCSREALSAWTAKSYGRLTCHGCAPCFFGDRAVAAQDVISKVQKLSSNKRSFATRWPIGKKAKSLAEIDLPKTKAAARKSLDAFRGRVGALRAFLILEPAHRNSPKGGPEWVILAHAIILPKATLSRLSLAHEAKDDGELILRAQIKAEDALKFWPPGAALGGRLKSCRILAEHGHASRADKPTNDCSRCEACFFGTRAKAIGAVAQHMTRLIGLNHPTISVVWPIEGFEAPIGHLHLLDPVSAKSLVTNQLRNIETSLGRLEAAFIVDAVDQVSEFAFPKWLLVCRMVVVADKLEVSDEVGWTSTLTMLGHHLGAAENQIDPKRW
jgi:hypothetical protein